MDFELAENNFMRPLAKSCQISFLARSTSRFAVLLAADASL